MTYIEQAIRDAHEARWWPKKYDSRNTTWGAILPWVEIGYHEHLLDPLFWQALGKARGWKPLDIDYAEATGEQEQWLKEWHRFVDHLADGKDPESFFKEK